MSSGRFNNDFDIVYIYNCWENIFREFVDYWKIVSYLDYCKYKCVFVNYYIL